MELVFIDIALPEISVFSETLRYKLGVYARRARRLLKRVIRPVAVYTHPPRDAILDFLF